MSAKPPTRTSYADRLKVTKGYVNYVCGLYRRWLNGVHGRPPTSPKIEYIGTMVSQCRLWTKCRLVSPCRLVTKCRLLTLFQVGQLR